MREGEGEEEGKVRRWGEGRRGGGDREGEINHQTGAAPTLLSSAQHQRFSTPKVLQSILTLTGHSVYMQIDKNMHYLDDEGNWPE